MNAEEYVPRGFSRRWLYPSSRSAEKAGKCAERKVQRGQAMEAHLYVVYGQNMGTKKSGPETERNLLAELAARPGLINADPFRRQCAALCFRRLGDETEILLITSRATGRWVIPKGWPMKGKKAHTAAAIEALEEAGVVGKVKRKSVGCYTYLKLFDNGDVLPCVVDVFQLEFSSFAKKFKERGQRQMAWVSPSEAARMVREVELKFLLARFDPS